MTNDQLDEVILKIIHDVSAPLTVPEIERRVADRSISADTYDVQRSVRRLVKAGRASLTKRLDVAPAAS